MSDTEIKLKFVITQLINPIYIFLIWPAVNIAVNKVDITFRMLPSLLSGYCNVITRGIVTLSAEQKPSETGERCVKIVIIIAI